jgi:catechol 2,3-dioxygenase-like lactoylglutathione lyase family enzyme
MRIELSGIVVDDQDKALRFYTDVLGFVKKNDIRQEACDDCGPTFGNA